MKQAVNAVVLTIALLGGCAHGGTASRRATTTQHTSAGTVLLLVGVVAAGVAVFALANEKGTPECQDPLGRCGEYSY